MLEVGGALPVTPTASSMYVPRKHLHLSCWCYFVSAAPKHFPLGLQNGNESPQHLRRDLALAVDGPSAAHDLREDLASWTAS